MMQPGIRPATIEDVRHVARNLRQEDRAEVRALTGAPPELVLPECFHISRATWAIHGWTPEAVGLFGLQDVYDNPDVGWVWMLLCPIVTKYPLHFLRGCRELLPLAHTFHRIITNHVDERNTAHIKWLRWLGFSFLRRIERWGAENRPFLEFARLQPSCASQQSAPSSPPA